MDALYVGLQNVFSLQGILLMMTGTVLGITVGAIPGLTGAMLIALTLPLTFSMDAPNAFILLMGMYVGAISGGLITATLLRMPGTPASIMTTLDGYPMAKSGKPGRALGLGITASFVGGLISWCFLILLSKPIASISTKLGPFEFFTLVLLALVLIASIGGNSMSKAFFSAFLGILTTMPGMNLSTGELRMTFGWEELNGGLGLLPVLIGLFAISQIVKDITRIEEKVNVIPVTKRSEMLFSMNDWKVQMGNLFRSSSLGTLIGLLPGIGPNIGSVTAYTAAKSMATPEEKAKFGKGSEIAICAAEAANNATIGGSLIPMISLGIPGQVIDAILLGALIIHGLQPGPLLYEQNPSMVYTIMITLFIANIFMFFFMIYSVKHLAKIVTVPRSLMMPVILVFCIIGAYAMSTRLFDVWTMLFFGLVGFVLEKVKVPLAPFVIGYILAPIAEENLMRGLMSSNGSFMPILTRPVSLIFLLIAVVLLVIPLYKRYKRTAA